MEKPLLSGESAPNIGKMTWQPALPEPGDFFYPTLKVAWAKAHIGTVEQWVKQYIDSGPIRFRSGFLPSPPDVKDYVFSVGYEEASKRTPPWVGLPIGDAIHNLRTALDCLACDLAIKAGRSPNKVQFPFADSKLGLEDQIRKKNFRRTGEDCVSLLETLKPFKNGNIALRALHDLDIINKHSTVSPAVVAAFSEDISDVYADKFTDLPISVAGSVVLTFPVDGPLGGQEIVPSLHYLTAMVEDIIEQFTALIANRPK